MRILVQPQLSRIIVQGGRGAPGIDGTGITWRGAWSAGTTYSIFDSVQHDGSSYVATAPSIGYPPPDSAYWELSAAAGAVGADGATWTTGTGIPSGGVDGDLYLDTATDNVYKRTSGTWAVIANIKGTAGVDGADGSDGAPGAAGTNGTNGVDGKTVRNGSGAPSSGLGIDGDFYIDTTAKAIYGPKTSGAWGSATSLIGPSGADGADGNDGAPGAAGPNTVSTSTATNITGILKGNGTNVSQASAGIDFMAVGAAPSLHASSHAAGAVDALSALNIGAPYLHGIYSGLSKNSLSFNASTHVLTLTDAHVYYFHGAARSQSANVACDLDDFTISTGLWFIYYADATGVLTASKTPWSIYSHVPVAMLWWNGSAARIYYEGHGARRDLAWHYEHHTYEGTQISAADYAATTPSVGSPGAINIAGGTVSDEDLSITHGTMTNCVLWHQTGASVYTWEEASTVYGSSVRFADSANGYALTSVADAKFINIWGYVTTDTTRGLSCVIETKAGEGYNTAALARAAQPPNLAAMGLSPEMRLVYRWIYRGDETLSETTDYRASAVLAGAGGSASPSASGVTFAPAGNIAATNVQAALEELDAEMLTLGTGANQAMPGNTPVGGGITWSVVTGATNAVKSNGYVIDLVTAAASVTLTLPGSPTVGDVVAVRVVSSGTHVATVARNSLKIAGAASDLTIDVANAGFALTYTGTTHGWMIVDDIPANSSADAGVDLASVWAFNA